MDNPANRKPASRHTLRVALATGTTVAALIGAQAVAIFGRTAQAQPVIVGARADDTETPIPSSVSTQTDVPTAAMLLSPSATPQLPATSLPSNTSLPTATALPSTTPIPRVYYTVKSGDTLGIIASRFKTSVQTIMALNPGTLTNSNLVQVGQKLLIDGPLPSTATQVPTSTDAPASATDSSVDTTSLSSAVTQVSTSTPWPTSTPIPTWTSMPTQVYRAPVQPAPRTKSS